MTPSVKGSESEADSNTKRSEALVQAQETKALKKSKSKTPAGRDGDSDPKVTAVAKQSPRQNKKKDKKSADKEPESLLNQNQDAVLPIPSVPVQAARRISAKRIEDILMFTLEANTYLHGIQAERGVSTCYVASKGQMLQELLTKVRKDTDEAAVKLKKCDICIEAGNELLREGALRQFRKDVDFFDSPYLHILTGYNMLIDGLLEEVFKLVNPLHSIDIGMVLGCYNSFLYLKDTIGRMRAHVGCILSVKGEKAELTEMEHLTLVANLGAQKAFTKAFISTGISADIRTDFMNWCRECPADVTLLDRNLMISRGAAWSVISQIPPDGWFHTMSQRLNTLEKIQRRLTLNILETARRYCAKRKEAAEEKRASRAAKAAREKMAAGAANGSVSRGQSDDGIDVEGEINAGQRLVEVLSFIQGDEGAPDMLEWASRLGDVSNWTHSNNTSTLSQSAAAPAPEATDDGAHVSLASLFPGGGSGSAMASIMPSPRNES